MAKKDYSFHTQLYFTHGLEIEVHLVSRKTGEVIVGDVLLNAWNAMFEGATMFLQKVKKDKVTPKEIATKMGKMEVKEEVKREKRLKFIFLNYKVGKKDVRVNIFGPDPNISQITWLLELVVPPCEYLEELEFWVDTLFAAALHGLSKTPDVAILPIGVNPTEERVRSGLTCGEHHHIGISNELRIPIYNMIRNYVPHLIALSATSPFLNKMPSGKVHLRESNGRDQIIARCVHSYRLLKNSGQLGPMIPTYLPPLANNSKRNDFAKLVKKTPPDDRMVDIYPWTMYNTIELRFFDAQPWSENRLAIVLLIQALAQKAKNLLKNNESIPKVNAHSLYENRRKSIQFGLLAQFSKDETLANGFAQFYNYNITTGRRASKLIDSMTSMLTYIREELEGFGSNLVDFLLLPALGSKKHAPPLTVTEYLLYSYKKSGDKILSFLPNLYYTKEKAYPIGSPDGNIDSIQLTKVVEEEKLLNRETKLRQSLQEDLAKRKVVVPKVSKEPKKEPTKKVKEPKKVAPRKKPIKRKKKKPIETPSIEVKKVPILTKPTEETPEPLEVATATTTPISKSPDEVIISAFEETEDLEVFTHTIDIEPKYQKIESKIASVMRTRRIEIEKKRREFFKAHLKAERIPFKPSPKKTTAIFPSLVSGSEVFGQIEIEFKDIKRVMYKFQNNPITLIFTAKGNGKVRSKFNTSIDIATLEKRGKIRIPCSINLGELYGEITVTAKAITATNESLLPRKFSFKLTRRDEITITPKEFYITGNYGLIECVFQATNDSTSSERGELEVFLVTQSHEDPVPIYYTKFNLKPKENLELARSIDLLVNYQHSPFYIVSQVTIGRFTKNRSFKTIRVPIMKEIFVDWNFTVDPTKRYNLREGVEPKKQYEVDFVYHFIKAMPPVTITIFINTLPRGQTKKLADLRIKRDIDPGDEFVLPNIKFKTPKDCGYLFFDVEIRTEHGLIPLELISEPIGVQSKTQKSSTFEEKLDLNL